MSNRPGIDADPPESSQSAEAADRWPSDRWPPALQEVFERSITMEYASLTRAGQPITIPTTPYSGADGATIDLSTGLTYPAKAERARRNPKVALLLADPKGLGMHDQPAVLVQGHAAVRDADLQANADRYVRESRIKLPETTKGQPAFLLRKLSFYFARIWIEVTPLRMWWWADRNLDQPSVTWSRAQHGDAALPQSDPSPLGHQPPPWLEAPTDWPARFDWALQHLPFCDLTTVDTKGFPLIQPVRAGPRRDREVALYVGVGALEFRQGPACLTLHDHPETFTAQENRTFVGSLAIDSSGPVFRIERALADWSLAGNRAQISIRFLATGRRLAPRLKEEARRRGQPVPKVNI